jgi:ssDNA-binding Zn-finger/Zn-ribbon topoisomerase 1
LATGARGDVVNELGSINSEGQLLCYCGSLMVSRESEYGEFFGCERWPDCDGIVGAHKKTGEPLGLPAPQWVRSMRHRLHGEFDQLWKGHSRYARSAEYKWLADVLNLTLEQCHIGRFDSELCVRAMEAIAKRRPQCGVEEQVIEMRAEQERRRQKPAGLVDELPPDDDIPF